jgi:nuclear pore complex protein Nup188
VNSCLCFIHAILPTYPHRVWPLVGRSGLLEIGRGGGRLSSIVSNVELVSGHFEFLLACSRLFEGLVDDFLVNSVLRLSGREASTRFNATANVGGAIPPSVISNTLLSFTRYFVDVLESSCAWKFAVYDDRRQLSKTLITAFDQMLRAVYGIDSQPKPRSAYIDSQPRPDLGSKQSSKILFNSAVHSQFDAYEPKKAVTSLLAAMLPAAEHVVDSFLSPSSGHLRFQPLLEAFNDGYTTSPSTTFINAWDLCVGQVNAALSFSATLLRVGTLLERSQSRIESQLFKASPLITRLYGVDGGYRLRVVALFEALIVSSSAKTGEPPSLLGHLGAQTSRNFLNVLSELDQPLCRQDCIVEVWHFLAAVLSNRQQWFANYLLTGKSAKSAYKNSGSVDNSAASDTPILCKLYSRNDLSWKLIGDPR